MRETTAMEALVRALDRIVMDVSRATHRSRWPTRKERETRIRRLLDRHYVITPGLMHNPPDDDEPFTVPLEGVVGGLCARPMAAWDERGADE